MKHRSDSSHPARQAGAKIPEKPRDCGPNVDTWPILDTPVGDAARQKSDEGRNPKAVGKS